MAPGSDLLQHGRRQSNLPIERLSEFLFTKEVLDHQDRILGILTSEKVFDKSQNYFDGRIDRFKTALTHQKRLQQLSLIIGGKSYGPHPFVVQVRDLKSHEPMENVHVGDVGPKFGYNTMDNGSLLVNHVKVPHVNMLAKFSSVDPKTNKYVKPASASLVYGTLTWVRSTIVLQSGSVLARGVTMATRYAAVRRQFQDRDAKEWETGENHVLNYTMVPIRLLPLLAATFALHFTGRGMTELYQENQKKMAFDEGKLASTDRGPSPEELFPSTDLLADLHATSCGLKALASTTAAEGLEVCRRACGGHDYSSFSGIGSWYADYLPTTTWEGDNPLNHRDEEKGLWNSLLVDFWRLSTAYSQYMVVKNFYDALQSKSISDDLDPDTIYLLRKLFRLYALHTLEREAREFFYSSAVTVRQIQLARTKAVMKLLEDIRPHAVRLVDAWRIPDWQLDSSLGRYDGRVYEDLFHRASELNPLNVLTAEVLIKEDKREQFKSKL
ncbi:MAG: hypothetical protein Q9210_001199 [Variospora velana]